MISYSRSGSCVLHQRVHPWKFHRGLDAAVDAAEVGLFGQIGSRELNYRLQSMFFPTVQ
jgi:hypothetical protein